MTLPLSSRHVNRKQDDSNNAMTTTPTPTPEDAALLCSISSTASTPTAGNGNVVSEKVVASLAVAAPLAACKASNSKPEASTSAPAVQQQPQQQQYVDHSYSDYAQVIEDDLRLMKEAAKGSIAAGGNAKGFDGMLKSKGSSVMPFPGKLLEVLDRGDLTSIIDWMPHGRAFIVKQPKVFTTQVLPRFFKQTKFLSFTRQLNLWGFKRITRGLDGGAYYHALFLPGRPNLAMRMKRQKIKGTGIRPIPNPEQEPNFYYEYPHVAKVPRSTVPIPLPPLPSERIANLMGTTGPIFAGQVPGIPQQQHHAQQVQPVLSQSYTQQQQQQQLPSNQRFTPSQPSNRQSFTHQPQVASDQHLKGLANLAVNLGNTHQRAGSLSMNSMGNGGRGLGGMGYLNNDINLSSLAPSKNTLSAAAAAEHRLHGSMKPGAAMNMYTRSGSNNGLPSSQIPSARPEASFEPALAPRGLLDPTSNIYVRRASLNTGAPRSFAPSVRNDDHDEVSNANRRLMERLMDQTTSAPAPQDLMSLRRPSLLGHHGLATPQPLHHSLHEAPGPAIRRESFHQLHRSPSSALFSGIDLSSYMQHHHTIGSRASSLPSSLTVAPGLSTATAHAPSSRHQEINVSTVTNALREAQRLEELARSQRDTARALAGALRQRMGGHDITLPLGHYDGTRGDQM